MKKIKESILPPKDFNSLEAGCWFHITGNLQSDESLYEEHLPQIERLCKLEAERNEIIDNIGADLPRLFRQDPENNPKYYLLSDPKKFDDLFSHFINRMNTHEEAYEAVEFLYGLAHKGESKYSSYDSYRTTRRNRILSNSEK